VAALLWAVVVRRDPGWVQRNVLTLSWLIDVLSEADI
jgi:hypothetical protein